MGAYLGNGNPHVRIWQIPEEEMEGEGLMDILSKIIITIIATAILSLIIVISTDIDSNNKCKDLGFDSAIIHGIIETKTYCCSDELKLTDKGLLMTTSISCRLLNPDNTLGEVID